MCKPFGIDFHGWATVLGLFLQTSMYLGTIKSFGIYLTGLESSLGTTDTDLGLILGLYSGFVYVSAPVFTYMLQYVQCRRYLLVTGAVLASMSLVIGSIVSSNGQLAACLSLSGMGGCILSMCCIISLEELSSFYLLYGLGKSGYSFGIVLVPLLADYLMGIYGWRGSMMIIGAVFGNLIPLAMLIAVKNSRADLSVESVSSSGKIPKVIFGQKHITSPGTINTTENSQPNEQLEQSCIGMCQLNSESEINSFGSNKNGRPGPYSRDVKDVRERNQHKYAFKTFCTNIYQTSKETVSQLRRQWMHVYIPASILGGMVGSGWHSFLIPRTVSSGVPLSSAISILYPAAIASFFGRDTSGLIHRAQFISTLDAYLVIKSLDALSLLADILIKPYAFKFVTTFVNAFCIAEVNVLIVFLCKERTTSSYFPLTIACWSVSYGSGSLLGTYFTGLIADQTGGYTAPFLLLAALDVLVISITIPGRYFTLDEEEAT